MVLSTPPRYPKANGEVERAVKKMMTSTWPLLDYRTTPLPDIDLSPAQLLMGCRLRNKLPMMESLLRPASNNQQEISRYLEKTKENQRKYYDRHASRDMKELEPGAKVLMQPWTNSKYGNQPL